MQKPMFYLIAVFLIAFIFSNDAQGYPITFQVNISANPTILPVGSVSILTATVNRDVGPTPYFIRIYEGNTVIRSCGSGTSCSVNVTKSSSGTYYYYAKIERVDGTDTQATSNTVNVTWSGGVITTTTTTTTTVTTTTLPSGLSTTCSGRTTSQDTATISPTTNWQTISGSLSPSTDTKRYKITITSPGQYEFSLCPADGGNADFDSYICIFDSSGNFITSNDDYCTTQSKIRYSFSSTGTYYVQISGYSSRHYGSYTLAYRKTPVTTTTTTTISTTTTSTTTSTTTTISTCDYSSYSSCIFAYNFGTGSGSKSNMCGIYQYYKISTPFDKTCDIAWTVTPDSNSDYDLYVKWSTTCPSISDYDCRPFKTTGQTETCSKTSFSGTAYALVRKYSGSGSYTISVSVTNCR